MAPRPWTVLTPGPLTRIDDGLWCVTDAIPTIPRVTRRMSIVRRGDGSLLFYNAVPLTDAQLDEVRALGRPAALLLPCHLHMIDGPAFAQKLGIPAFIPAAGLEHARKRLPSVQPLSELPAQPSHEVLTVEGFSTHEACLVVRHGAGCSLLCADVFTNVPHLGGLGGLVMRLVGFTGPTPKLPGPVKKRVGKDLAQVRTFFERAAALPGLQRLVPSHGAIVDEGASAALRAIAQTV